MRKVTAFNIKCTDYLTGDTNATCSKFSSNFQDFVVENSVVENFAFSAMMMLKSEKLVSVSNLLFGFNKLQGTTKY